ncbi:MAG: DUF2726 domain-containing protein [Anaerolineales bacterium]
MTTNTQITDRPGCFGRILALLGIKPKEIPIEKLPYRVRDDFLSQAEHSFYQVLRSMMGEHFTICPKVNLRDIFYVAKRKDSFGAYNRINRKHIDFIICEPKTMRPKFAIELDDSSHKRSDRSERDQFVNKVFAQAGLPLVRVQARDSYSQSELGELFRSALSQSSPTQDVEGPPANAHAEASEVSNCPKCGIPMVMREAKRGSRKGERFYGCENYPQCRETMPI